MRLEYHWIPPAVSGRPALVFLHEGLGCIAMWRGFPERVAAATGCGALIYSRAGYGQSSPVALPRPLRYMHDEGLDVLPRLLRTLELEKVILVGHSDGGSIALIYGGGGQAPAPLGIVTLAAHVFNEDVCVASIRAAREAYLDGDLRRRLERFHGANVDCAFRGWNGAWLDPGFMQWNLEEYLPPIAVPVLVIQGADDQYGTAAQYRAIQAGCGGPTELLVVEQCGHSPHIEQAEKTVAAVVRFVNSLNP
ncbi:MAG: alpha/beta hydrolase [Alphaproteobacteria bacterium]|nr:alpha/beta hydrolase [Alphaproteobacteria bacterium]